MKKQVLLALGYTLFMGMLTVGVCLVSKANLHRLGERIDSMGQVLASSTQKNLHR